MFAFIHLLIALTLVQTPDNDRVSQSAVEAEGTQTAVMLEWGIVQLDRAMELPAKTPAEVKHFLEDARKAKPSGGEARGESMPPQCAALAPEFRIEDFTAALEAKYGKESQSWRVLAMPRVLANLGQEAEVSVGRQIPYMVKREDGSFVMENSPEAFEGMTTTLLVDEGDEQSISVKKAVLRLSRVVGRQAIEGCPFEVGYPIINTREVHTALRIQPGRWVMFLLPDAGEGDPLILAFLQARIVTPSSAEPSRP